MAPSPQTRDAGVRRITRLTSWVLAGAVGLSAAVSFVVARSQTGNAASRGSNISTATTGSAAPVVIGPGTGGGGLQPPISPPTGQGGGGGVANSGGS